MQKAVDVLQLVGRPGAIAATVAQLAKDFAGPLNIHLVRDLNAFDRLAIAAAPTAAQGIAALTRLDAGPPGAGGDQPRRL